MVRFAFDGEKSGAFFFCGIGEWWPRAGAETVRANPAVLLLLLLRFGTAAASVAAMLLAAGDAS